MPLPPYKLVIWRNESHHPQCVGTYTAVYDHDENPIPSLKGNSLIKLLNCCQPSLKFTEDVIERVNSAEEIKASGSKYTLVAMDIYGNDWYHRALVLKLLDFNKGASTQKTDLGTGQEITETHRSINAQQPTPESSPILSESTKHYQPPYKVAVIQKKNNDWNDIDYVLLDILKNPVPQLYKLPHSKLDGESALLNLCGWPPKVLNLVQKITHDLNDSSELRGTNGQYYIIGSNQYINDDSCHVVWELGNSQAAFLKAMSETVEYADSFHTTSGQSTPTSTVF
ncbi:hypothetical protein TWF694_008948 [Orbilia ellipsospora]|uniref:Uncharacterized protein n=1 Tax=Orbilia ellipsospora TaxID=2528407 RepID=A0AAV9XEX7_9PEZI